MSAIEGKHDGEQYAGEYNTKAIALGGDLKWMVIDQKHEYGDALLFRDKFKCCVLAEKFKQSLAPLSGEPTKWPVEWLHQSTERKKGAEGAANGNDDASYFFPKDK